MPLSPPTSRQLKHQRSVECRGYLRDDGLWDIEGHLVDSKTYATPNAERSQVDAGSPIHDLWLRLTIDLDFLVHAVEVHMEVTPRQQCQVITPNYQCLEGLRIGPGWTRTVKQRLGGTQGCTHLVELLGPMATTAIQTLYDSREARDKDNPNPQRPGFIDTCHMWASDGPLVKERCPQYYTGK